jgi:hypothetical protein
MRAATGLTHRRGRPPDPQAQHDHMRAMTIPMPCPVQAGQSEQRKRSGALRGSSEIHSVRASHNLYAHSGRRTGTPASACTDPPAMTSECRFARRAALNVAAPAVAVDDVVRSAERGGSLLSSRSVPRSARRRRGRGRVPAAQGHPAFGLPKSTAACDQLQVPVVAQRRLLLDPEPAAPSLLLLDRRK